MRKLWNTLRTWLRSKRRRPEREQRVPINILVMHDMARGVIVIRFDTLTVELSPAAAREFARKLDLMANLTPEAVAELQAAAPKTMEKLAVGIKHFPPKPECN